MQVSASLAYGAPPPRPYVRFEMRPVEKRTPEGQSFYEDTAWAILMAPGSRDTVEMLATDWIANMQDNAKNGRCPQEWPGEYAKALETWRQNQEQPLHGTALKLWPAITPGQLRSCESANIRTVEDLAAANSDSLARIGMGSVALKAAAKAWLDEQKGAGALAAKVADLSLQLEAAQRTIEELKAAKAAPQKE